VPDNVLLVDPLAELTAFRRGLMGCFTRHRDALFEVADAMLLLDATLDEDPQGSSRHRG